jgi:glyoxylase-like metal-dependent hydrolase (beta-lactamase superfamily II)
VENPFGPRTYGKLEQVTKRAWIFRNIVNSAVVVGEKGAAVIDTQVNKASARRVLAAAREVIGQKPILFAINTHYHWDHTNGNEVFAKAGATLISGARTKRYMVERAPRQKAFLASRGFALGDDPSLPEVVFEGTLELDLGGQRLRLNAMGDAETDDATTIHLPDEGIVCSGDTVMTGSFPIFGQPVMSEGLMANRSWLEAVARIRALAPSAVLPGHGPVARTLELDLFERIMEYFLTEVRAAHTRGLALEELIPAVEANLPKWIRDLAEVWGTPRYAILRVWRGLVEDEEPGWQHRKPTAIPAADPAALAAKTAGLQGVTSWLESAREAIEGVDVAMGVALAREATRRWPDDAKAWVAFGRFLIQGSRIAASVLEKGDFFVEAKRSWERAQHLAPDFGPGHLLEGEMLVFTAYRNGDDTEHGEKKVRQAMELGLDAADESRALFLLGLAARAQGDEPTAKKRFQESVAKDPANFPARLAMA